MKNLSYISSIILLGTISVTTAYGQAPSVKQSTSFASAAAGKTAYILLINNKESELSFIDVHSLQKPEQEIDVFNIDLSDKVEQQVAATIPKLRAQGYRTLLIVNPFRANFYNIVVNTTEVAGDSEIEENPAYYKAQQRLELAEQKYESARQQMQYTADSAQQSATGTTSRVLGAAAIMMSGASASRYAEEVNRARAALAGTPRTIRVTQTRNVAVPRAVFEQAVIAELSLSLCDLQARLCAQKTLPMSGSKQVDVAAIALKSSKYYETHLSRLQNFSDDFMKFVDEQLATDISTQEMIQKFENQSLTIPTAAIMRIEAQQNTEYQSKYQADIESRSDSADSRAMNIKAQITSIQDPYDDPLEFANYGEQQGQ